MLLSMTLLALIGTTMTFPSASASNCQYSGKREPLQALQTPEDEKYRTEYCFIQLKDHSNPSAGGFKQRYFFSDQYYKGQGSPIIISTPGEIAADDFWQHLTDSGASLMNAMMKDRGAAGVVLEHRYWGKSLPFESLTTENLTFLTVNQAIEDFKYFVENVDLPWTSGKGSHNSKPSVTPWVNMGCSYPGQLVTLVQEKHPDLFAAGYASSAPLNASGDFWQYWKPIEDGMPKNCVSDLTAAMAHMDQVMSMVIQDEANALKEKFGVEAHVDNFDFAERLMFPFTEWQDANPVDYLGNAVFKLCDAIEGSNTSAQGIGMPQALEKWAKAWKKLCPNGTCQKSDKATSNPGSGVYTKTASPGGRPWDWLLCTQLGWFEVGNPGNVLSIASSQVRPDNSERYCNDQFPRANGAPPNYNLAKSADAFNAEFKSWNVVGKNLYTVNGQFDPWRSVSLSSDWAPPFVNTSTQKATVIPGAHHCWDWSWSNGKSNSHVRDVQLDGIHQIGIWLEDWYAHHPDVKKPITAMRVQTIGDAYDTNETREAVFNNLEDKVDDLSSRKTVMITSYSLNGVLVLSAIVALVFFVITKRAKPKSSSIPRWSTENGEIPQRKLGEKYQHLKGQMV